MRFLAGAGNGGQKRERLFGVAFGFGLGFGRMEHGVVGLRQVERRQQGFGAQLAHFAVQFFVGSFEGFDDHRIEQDGGFHRQHFHRLPGSKRGPVAAARGHLFIGIDDGQDARSDGDILATQPFGIPRAVPVFMMGADDRRNRIGELARSRISAPTTGWILYFSCSSLVSLPGLVMM